MEANKNHLTIAFKVFADEDLKPIDLTFQHTEHSYLRACQRGLNSRKITVALKYGKIVRKQGLLYYILGEANIPEYLEKEKDKLRNTVVIVSGDSNQVITCYRSPKPFKNIRLKSKRLGRYRDVA